MNNELITAYSMGFLATIAGKVKRWDYDLNVGIHFFCKNTSRLSEILMCGAAVSGVQVNTWHKSFFQIEKLATKHQNKLLCLYDLQNIKNKNDVYHSPYMLAQGVGKTRMVCTKGDYWIPYCEKWNNAFLSTGTIGIPDFIRQKKITELIRSPSGCLMARIIHVPLEYMLYNDKDNSDRGYSPDGKKFAMMAKKDMKIFQSIWEANCKEIYETKKEITKEEITNPVVERIADNLALVATAGEFASRYSLAPWNQREALNALKNCFCAYVKYSLEEGVFDY